MNTTFSITQEERHYLRELAKKQLEYANLSIMDERKKLWYAHNGLKGERPVIVMEMDTFKRDLLPAFKCHSKAAIEIEKNLLIPIINHELIDDDKVVPNYYTVYSKIHINEFDFNIRKQYAVDATGREVGFTQEHPIKNLPVDLPQLKHSTYHVDREYTYAWKSFVEEVIGDILPVKLKNDKLKWHVVPSRMIVDLMGLENMMYAMMDYPEELHQLYEFIKNDILNFIKWQEKEGLLSLNNKNDYAGAGSYGFTNELPSNDFDKTQLVTTKDIWVNMNSQESVGISSSMYGEFIFPYYRDLAKEFGLVYYGCCEPVHDIWDDYISKLPNLRKVSVSPWCNEEFMGNALKGENIIYSRKPSPNFIGVGQFDEVEFKEHISHTLNAAKGCHLEIIFRDIYTLSGEKDKPRKAVKILRELIEDIW
ncbi:uroporphyrinogen decarboxylase/cobalamine-independent methonine synthase family protein [Vallitalea okinawensis]|uniref:hypothetical protein n=1 Tax=Vallitalea okinawensis TaxID=2078660 RepID=UPI000CFCE788|nr:hypothetical protein [Vallitalea okinawensis]